MSSDSGPSSPPAIERQFVCSRCGASAGVIQLLGTANDAKIVRNSFTSVLTGRVPPAAFELLRRALQDGDARAVHSIDYEYAPFYCPQCNACFCGDHWHCWDVFEDGWHDSICGRCPEGHERMLED